MAKPTRVLLVRHGQTNTNKQGRFCGHSETDLTELGQEQARALGRRLADTEIHACYTSDFSRAIETARLALGERALVSKADPELRELHYGEWELERGTAVKKKWPEQHALMSAEDPSWRPPGGETVGEVRERTGRAFERIVAAHARKTVLIVAHGTAINCMVSQVLRMPESHVFRFDVGNCALTEIEVRGGKPYIIRLNDGAHLAGLK